MLQLIGVPAIFSAVVFGLLYYFTGSLSVLYAAATLALIELSLSMDNASLNVIKLKEMSKFWRQVFIWVGMPIAVFGMRFYVPLEIVSSLEGISLSDAYHLAMSAPDKFAETLKTAHHSISAFGGAFLLLTAAEFFFGQEKEHDWLPGERFLTKAGAIRGLEFFAVFVALIFSYHETQSISVVLAGLGGCMVFILMSAIKSGLEKVDGWLGQSTIAAVRILQGGLGGFIFLEVLDASLSLDGVVAALAISHDIWVIAAGLGIGAMVVRELTLYLLKKDATAELKYLPNGAFFSILSLAIFMFVSMVHEVPDWLVSAVSLGFIIAAIVTSRLPATKLAQN